jgi:hypothetical protein
VAVLRGASRYFTSVFAAANDQSGDALIECHMELATPCKVPQQLNSSDCGLFVLKYCSEFLKAVSTVPFEVSVLRIRFGGDPHV